MVWFHMVWFHMIWFQMVWFEVEDDVFADAAYGCDAGVL
jgi:hypothetical protein